MTRSSKAAAMWETSDLVDDRTGILGRKLEGAVIVPAEMSITEDNQYLEWRVGKDLRIKKLQDVAFDDFLALAAGGPPKILKFAKKWGTLYTNRPITGPLSARDGRGFPLGEWHTTGKEAIQEWEFFATRGGAIVALASELKNGKFGAHELWSILGTFRTDGVETLRAATLQATSYGLPHRHVEDPADLIEAGFSRANILDRFRDTITGELNNWIKLAQVGVEARLERSDSWQVAVTWRSCLFGWLTLQLVYAVAGTKLRYSCASCGKLFSRKRRASKRNAAFCAECGRKAALRMGQQRRREKIAEARELAGRGVGVRAIAAQLKTEVENVRTWISKGR